MKNENEKKKSTLRIRPCYLNKLKTEECIEKYCAGPNRMYGSKAEFLRAGCVDFLLFYQGTDEIMFYDEPTGHDGEMKAYSIAVSPLIMDYIEYLVIMHHFGNVSDAIRIIMDWHLERIAKLVSGLIQHQGCYEIPDKIPIIKSQTIRKMRAKVEYKRRIVKAKNGPAHKIPKAIPIPLNDIFLPGQGLITVRPSKLKGEI